MAVVSAVISWMRYKRNASLPTELKISSPLSWGRILKYGVLFLIIQIRGDLAQRYLGKPGFLVSSVVGGLVSSASTAAAAALPEVNLRHQLAGYPLYYALSPAPQLIFR
jgi:uncharacterized membrane protein (DUF4010 family)